MKSFLIVLLCAILSCAPVIAGDDLAPVPNNGTVTVEKKLDMKATATTVIEEVQASCTDLSEKVAYNGQMAMALGQGLQQTIPHLKKNGVPESALASLEETKELLIKRIRKAVPLFRRGIILVQYATLVAYDAGDSASKKFEAVALYCKAKENLEAAAKELGDIEPIAEKTSAKVRELLESLDVRPTPAPPKLDVKPNVIEIPVYQD